MKHGFNNIASESQLYGSKDKKVTIRIDSNDRVDVIGFKNNTTLLDIDWDVEQEMLEGQLNQILVSCSSNYQGIKMMVVFIDGFARTIAFINSDSV